MKVDPKIKLHLAIDHAGSSAGLAKMLEIDRSNITRWQRQGLEHLPALHAFRFRELYLQQQAESLGSFIAARAIGGRVH